MSNESFLCRRDGRHLSRKGKQVLPRHFRVRALQHAYSSLRREALTDERGNEGEITMDLLLGIQIAAILLGLIGHALSIVRVQLARVSLGRESRGQRSEPIARLAQALR